MLLNADLALRTGTTFCLAKRSSSVVPRLEEAVVCGLPEPELEDFACPGSGGNSGVTISKPGSLGRPPLTSDDEGASTGLPSVTGLRRERLREWSGCGETTLKELEVDKLALTPDKPSDTLSDIAPAPSLVVANSLKTRTFSCARETPCGGGDSRVEFVVAEVHAGAHVDHVIEIHIILRRERIVLFLVLR